MNNSIFLAFNYKCHDTAGKIPDFDKKKIKDNQDKGFGTKYQVERDFFSLSQEPCERINEKWESTNIVQKSESKLTLKHEFYKSGYFRSVFLVIWYFWKHLRIIISLSAERNGLPCVMSKPSYILFMTSPSGYVLKLVYMSKYEYRGGAISTTSELGNEKSIFFYELGFEESYMKVFAVK